jgi:hypothetical protein
MKPVQIMTPLLRRLIRLESKLHNFASYCGVDPRQLNAWGYDADPVPYTEAEVTKALIRIESKLQSLMLHEGLNPHERRSA